MDQDETCRGSRLRPRRDSIGWGPSSSSSQKGHSPAQFLAHVCCAETAGWIKMPHGRKVGLGPGHIVLHGDPAAPSFRPMSIVAERSRPPQLLLSSCSVWQSIKPTPNTSYRIVTKAITRWCFGRLNAPEISGTKLSFLTKITFRRWLLQGCKRT